MFGRFIMNENDATYFVEDFPMALSETFSARLKWIQHSCNGFATAHGCMQDWYHFWELIITFANIALALLLLTFSLADEETILKPLTASAPITSLMNESVRTRVTMALLAALSLFLSLIDFIMKPAAKAAGHKAAVDKYVESKYAFRDIEDRLSIEHDDAEILNDYREARASYLNRENVPTIPELLYPALRLWHCLKNRMITFIDSKDKRN